MLKYDYFSDYNACKIQRLIVKQYSDFRWLDISSKKIHPHSSLSCKKKTSDTKELVHLKGDDYIYIVIGKRKSTFMAQ